MRGASPGIDYCDQRERVARECLGYLVSGRKLNFNFIGTKILETKETSYDNSLCKHRGHKILRYLEETFYVAFWRREGGGKKETSTGITL